MSKERFKSVIDSLLQDEGWPKFTNDTNDLGGPTKGGITLATLSDWRERQSTVAELMELTEREAREIYYHRYISAPNFDKIQDDRLAYLVIDAGVLHGPARAAMWLQAGLGGIAVDGRIGPATLAVLARAEPHVAALSFLATRARFIGRLVSDNYKNRVKGLTRKDQSRFAAGWIDRVMKGIDLEIDRLTSKGH